MNVSTRFFLCSSSRRLVVPVGGETKFARSQSGENGHECVLCHNRWVRGQSSLTKFWCSSHGAVGWSGKVSWPQQSWTIQTQLLQVIALLYLFRLLAKKVKASHTRYRALSPELIRCTGPVGGSLPLLAARPVVTFPAAVLHCLLAGTMLYCLVTEAHRCEQLAQGCYAAFAPSSILTHDLLIASPILYLLHQLATHYWKQQCFHFYISYMIK